MATLSSLEFSRTMSSLSPSTRKLLLRVAALCVIVAAIAWTMFPRNTDDLAALRIDPPQAMIDFQLTDGDNLPFTRARLLDKWSFVFFGYTHCPDVCPVTLSELAKVYQHLAQRPEGAATVQVVFVSVDPARDTPAQLKEYARYFNANFIATTGTLEQLDVLTGPLGVRHRRLTEQGAEYRVEHSADVWLIDPRGRLYARLPAPHYNEEIAKQFVALVQNAEDYR